MKSKITVQAPSGVLSKSFTPDNIIQLADGNWGYKQGKTIWFKRYEGTTFSTREELAKHINNGYTVYFN